jgi:hypothetical protein
MFRHCNDTTIDPVIPQRRRLLVPLRACTVCITVLLCLTWTAGAQEQAAEEDAESEKDTETRIVIEWGDEEDDSPDSGGFAGIFRGDDNAARTDASSRTRFAFRTAVWGGTYFTSYELELDGSDGDGGYLSAFLEENDTDFLPGISVHGNYYLTNGFAVGAGLRFDYPNDAVSRIFAIPLEALLRFNDRTAVTVALGPAFFGYDRSFAYGPDADELDDYSDLTTEGPWPYIQLGVQINDIWIGFAYTSDFEMNVDEDEFWYDYEGIPASTFNNAELQMSATSIGIGYVF